jgi:hypothetical protein
MDAECTYGETVLVVTNTCQVESQSRVKINARPTINAKVPLGSTQRWNNFGLKIDLAMG